MILGERAQRADPAILLPPLGAGGNPAVISGVTAKPIERHAVQINPLPLYTVLDLLVVWYGRTVDYSTIHRYQIPMQVL